MIGRSREVSISVGGNLSYDRNALINTLRTYGSTPVRVIISGDLVAQNTGVPCLEFPANLPNEYVILQNNATIYGRGGNGGTAGPRVGSPGGHGILNSMGTRLRIENNGSICGGGGGARVGSNMVSGGSGGRPFGAAGIAEGRDSKDGYAATLAAPGAQAPTTRYNSYGGAGGQVGAAGASGYAQGDQAGGLAGGAAGHALYGSAPTWVRLGNIYGARL